MFYNMFFVFIIFMVVFPNQSSAVKRIGHDEVYLGNDTSRSKTLRFNQQGLGVDPFIRYKSSDNKFIFRNDGTSTSQEIAFVDVGPLKPIIRTARCAQADGSHTCVMGNAGEWWSRVDDEAEGRTKINFNSDIFDGSSSEFSCYTTAINASNGITCRVHTVHANWLDVQCVDAAANPAINADSNFFILCLFHDS